jgi:LCP family protein required for cell wall assembly
MLIGSDFRPGVGGARGDALHVVGVNPRTRQATILNIPRDLCTSVGKINNGHAQGGPRRQAEVAGEVVGVSIAYAVSVDFAGFDSIVNAVGGVEVDVPAPMDDPFSGAQFPPGRMRMNGAQALAFSRDRHDFPRGDIQRTENQGSLLLTAFRQLQEEADDAAGELRLVALLARHSQLDGVGLADLYRLGRVAQRLDPDGVRNVTMPVVSGGCSGGLSPSGDAPSLFADFADDGVLQQH